MHAGLPKRVFAHRLALGEARIEGGVAVAELKRLAAMAAEPGGVVEAQIRFLRRGGRDALEISLGGAVRLQCQRCLEIFDFALASRSLIEVVADEAQARAVEEPAEPYISADGQLDLRELVEDEALLALPAVARHADPARCAALARTAGPAPEQTRRESPFAVLKDWQGADKRKR